MGETWKSYSVVSWDLQTGGIASVISWQTPKPSPVKGTLLSHIQQMGRWLEFLIGVLTPKLPTSSHVMLPLVYAYIPIRSTVTFHSQTTSGLTGNPCSLQLLMQQPLPSGKLGSSQVAHQQRSRPFPLQATFTPQFLFPHLCPATITRRFNSSLPHVFSSSPSRGKFWCGMFRIPNVCWIIQILDLI
jgi:hypothetical protein